MTRPTVAVVVASLGRPDIVADLLEDLRGQTAPADKIICSVTSASDVPAGLPADLPVEWIFGAKGSCVQRNAAIDRLGTEYDIIACWDDDYVPSRFALERIRTFFLAFPDVAGASGRLLADGVNDAGIGIDTARQLLETYDRQPAPPLTVHRDLPNGLYGCNMVLRAAALRDVRFDERLPLYGWQEDIDLSARLRTNGRIVRTFAFAGVHRGTKLGRGSGVRLGYSQVINPLYLVRKGTMRWRYAARIVGRNVIANLWRARRPEPWVDRAGRVKGNWLGVLDVLRGRIRPDRVERL